MLAPPWYVNGFPKSGTHMITAMLMPFARPMPDRRWAKYGTMINSFAYHAWVNKWHHPRYLTYAVSHTDPGFFYRGHCGYRIEFDRTLDWAGLAMVFVYRDLRDVAVSQAFHILNETETAKHLDKAAYRRLGGFDEVLEAVIAGLQVDDSQYGPVYYPGVVERWELYAPWLDVDWVLPVRYADARRDPERAAARILRYGMARLAGCLEVAPPELPPKLVRKIAKAMADSSRDTSRSSTFRKGQIGGWREHFTERHKRAWADHDPNGWTERLEQETRE